MPSILYLINFATRKNTDLNEIRHFSIKAQNVYHAHYTADLIEKEIKKIRKQDYELRKEYFPHDIGKRPLCRGVKWNKFKYDTLEDGTHYSNHRIGRDHIRKFEKAYNSNLCMKNDYNKPVVMYNLLHEPVAVFNNEYIAAETVKIPVNRVQYDCKNSKQQPQKDFYFKYKN